MFLHLDNISYSYPGSGCVLFSDLSLSFAEGWTVIAGANGSGKSTLISIAAGLIPPDSGSVRKSGEAILCPQVFDGLMPEDWIDIFSGSNHVGMLKSTLALTDGMIEREQTLSGGEKKRLQILAALSHSPEILVLDEPTNHLDIHSKDLLINALRLFDGIGIIVTHDREFAASLSSRTIILERGTDNAASFEDIPLPLPAALEESSRRRREGRDSYDRIQARQKALSKKGISSKDHDAKAKIDGARLTGKDASLDGAMRNHLSHSRQLGEKLASSAKPLMRKEGLSFIGNMRIPDISFPESVINIGDYNLSIPSLSVKAGTHIALTGKNGSGKTLFLKAIHRHLEDQGKSRYVLYLPQEFSEEETERMRLAFTSLEDDEKGLILSDMYRMGSNPSALFQDSLKLSPGEMKKLAIALSRRDGKTVLLMDEPTNHLDIASMRILERMLREDCRDMTMILVSHDRAFLSACTDTTWKAERNGNRGRIVIT